MSSREFIESREEMEKILSEETIGFLGMSLDGEPYVVALNHGYVEGKILFHCAMEGKKLDYLKANPRVCYTVARQLGPVRRHPEGDPCHVDNDSVICYGTARIVEDPVERQRVLTTFNRSYVPDAEEIPLKSAMKACAVEITVAEMTGRREREKKRTYWRYRFEE